MKKQTIADDSILRKIQPGEIIYTKLIHVSRSGMARVLDLYMMRENVPLRITWSAAEAIGVRYDRKREGLVIGGCGTDVGFEAVYHLGRVLFPDFRCSGKDDCPSNDHVNERGEERKAGYATGRKHSDGGYALRQRWL